MIYLPLNESNLMNIVNGVVADEKSNVDCFYSIGEKIVAGMVGEKVFEYSFSRKDIAKTMSVKAKIGKKNEIEIDPALLFQRLLVVANASPIASSDVFAHELCSYPPALMESPTMLRKADKPQIVEAVFKLSVLDSHDQEIDEMEETSGSDDQEAYKAKKTNEDDDVRGEPHSFVLDGGSLLYRIKWKKDTSYQEIADSYASFVSRNYKNATVIFDGYLSGPSTKDNTHIRRTAKGESKQINFTPEMKFSGIKKTFLNNIQNKSRMIQLIGASLQHVNCKVHYSEEDADVDIAVRACQDATLSNVTVVGEDSDLLVLLIYYSTIYRSQFKLLFKSDVNSKYDEHDIYLYRDALGETLSAQLLFIHAFSGCDTTSSFFGIGKQTVLNFYLNNPDFQEQSKIFTTLNRSHNEIKEAGLRATLSLYGARKGEIMANLRARTMSEKVLNSTTFVKPERLPPTEDALKYHSLRCYLQILKWMGIEVKGEGWGWFVYEGMLYPKTMDSKCAPDKLLEIVHCNCKSGCTTMRCSCKKNGLKCTYVIQDTDVDDVIDL